MSVEALPRSPGLTDGVARRFAPRFLRQSSRVEAIQGEELYAERPLLIIEGATVESKALHVHGREIEAFSITPHAYITPQGRIFLANGWRGRVKGSKEYITQLVQAGYTITSFNNEFTNGDTLEMKEADAKMAQAGKDPVIEFIKADAIAETLAVFPSQTPDEKIGLVAHSEATIYAGIAAINLGNFDYFIQINSAGHAKKTSFAGQIIKGGIENMTAKKTEFEEEDPNDKTSAKDVINYVRRHSGVARAELRSIRSIKTDRLVEHMHKQGLPTAHISGLRDWVFPHRNLKSIIDKGIFDYVGVVEDGAHEIASNPQGYAERTCQAIDALRLKNHATAQSDEIVLMCA